MDQPTVLRSGRDVRSSTTQAAPEPTPLTNALLVQALDPKSLVDQQSASALMLASSSDTAVPCATCPLRALPSFSPLTDDERHFIQDLRSGMVAMEAGREILAEHASSEWLFTVFSGWAFRFKTLSDGRRQILNFLLPGDFVGLQEQFADGAPHGVEALTDVRLCRFPKAKLWGLYREFPSLGYDITWLAAREENLTDEALLSVGRRTAMERIAMMLIHLYRRAARIAPPDERGIPFPVSQQHIADALGLSLVHTNKTLRKLEKMGLHRIEGGRLQLLNPRALARIADHVERPMRAIPLL